MGEIQIEQVAYQLTDYLSRFDQIVETYRQWLKIPVGLENLAEILAPCGRRHRDKILQRETNGHNAYDAYNVATYYATHETRSFRTAFRLLDQINQGFQKAFPVSPASVS